MGDREPTHFPGPQTQAGSDLRGEPAPLSAGGQRRAQQKSHLEGSHPCSESPELSRCPQPGPGDTGGDRGPGHSSHWARGELSALCSGAHIWEPSNHDRPMGGWGGADALSPSQKGGRSSAPARGNHLAWDTRVEGIYFHTTWTGLVHTGSITSLLHTGSWPEGSGVP